MPEECAVCLVIVDYIPEEGYVEQNKKITRSRTETHGVIPAYMWLVCTSLGVELICHMYPVCIGVHGYIEAAGLHAQMRLLNL